MGYVEGEAMTCNLPATFCHRRPPISVFRLLDQGLLPRETPLLPYGRCLLRAMHCTSWGHRGVYLDTKRSREYICYTTTCHMQHVDLPAAELSVYCLASLGRKPGDPFSWRGVHTVLFTLLGLFPLLYLYVKYVE